MISQMQHKFIVELVLDTSILRKLSWLVKVSLNANAARVLSGSKVFLKHYLEGWNFRPSFLSVRCLL